jgi:flagellar motor switch protein FliG
MSEPASLRGIDRVAVLLMAIGEEYAAEIFKHLEPRELHTVGSTMANLANINRDQVSEILQVFNEQVENQTSMGVGSHDYIRAVLIRALGRDKAKNIMENILDAENVSGVEALKWVDPKAVAGGIRNEHPQVVAMILSCIDVEQAADVLALLPEELRHDAMMRLAALEGIPSGALVELNEVIETQVAPHVRASTTSKVSGPKRAAEILNMLDRALESTILDKIKSIDLKLGERIEDLMVVFDHLLDVDDRGIQHLLREVPSETLIVALRGADEMIREKILRNMSRRAAEMLRDDLEVMSPVRLTEVEAAQKEMLSTARRLAEAGELSLGGKGEEQLV